MKKIDSLACRPLSYFLVVKINSTHNMIQKKSSQPVTLGLVLSLNNSLASKTVP